MDQKKGLANVIAGILNKKVKEDKVILSKSKSAKEIALKKLKKDENAEILLTQDQDGAEFVFEGRSEVIDDTVVGKKSVSEREKQIKKRTWEEMGRSKPDVLQKETERNLQRIATKGVVQLFNAVKKQQKLMNERIEDAGPSERKKEKALQSISKGQFLDLLKGKPDHESANPEGEEIEESSEKKSGPAWNILRDDFMLGAKMKDWDKVSDNDSDEQEMIDENESDGSC